MTILPLNPDFLDFIQELQRARARFVVVGNHALAVHGIPRATGDFAIFVEPTAVNAGRVLEACRAFGAPVDAHGLTEDDLATPGMVYQMGLPPSRIDLITAIDGVTFDQAWEGRFVVSTDEAETPFLGRAELIANKRAAGRAKDVADLEELEKPG